MSIESACGHCGERLDIVVDQDLNWTVRQPGAEVLIFEPDIDWSHFEGRTIVPDY